MKKINFFRPGRIGLKLKKDNKLNRAFTLIETLVAISIFTMSILGLMSILASGISDINYAKNKITAAYIAQDGIEYIRNMRDTYVLYSVNGWDNFKAADKTYPSPYSNFTRIISMIEVNDDEVKIFSSVSWTQGYTNHNITFSENLFNWIE